MNQSTGAASVIGATGFDDIGDLTSDTRSGSAKIWGVRIDSKDLLSIDPATGAASVAATLNSPDKMVSIAFDPVTGKLYGNTSIAFGAPFDALYQIDPATGNSTFIGRILFNNVFALGFDQSGKLFGVADDTNQFISISTATGNGAAIATLQLNQVFDMASRPEDNQMFIVDSGTHHLSTINTTTGQVTDVGPYTAAGPDLNLVGLAFFPIPEPGTLVLAGFAALGLLGFAWRRRRPPPAV
jgi:hypothetical protein